MKPSGAGAPPPRTNPFARSALALFTLLNSLALAFFKLGVLIVPRPETTP